MLLRRFWEWVVSKSGPPLAILFVAGDDPQSVAIADEIGRSRPGMTRLIVSWRKLDEQRFREVREFIVLDSSRPWRSVIRWRLKLLRRRVALTVTQPTSDMPLPHALTVWGAARERLAYNGDGERYRIDWRRPIAARRFLRGMPEADIRRPARLAFLGKWLRWPGVLLLLVGWRLRRRTARGGLKVHRSAAGPKMEPATSDGCSVVCVPGAGPAELDRHVLQCKSLELVVTRELAFPSSDTIAALHQRLRQPGVWLVCARGDFKHVLGEGWAPHRSRESGTFCLGARSSLVAVRRDVFLELGGLAAFEQQLPGQGWAALSLRALLRGYKTIYAGDIDARALAPPAFAAQPIEGPPLASLLPACDDVPTAARLLHRFARTAEFRRDYRDAVRRLRLPAARGRRSGKLTPLVEPGAVILKGRDTRRSLRLAILAPELPFPAAKAGGMRRVHHLVRRLAEHCDLFLFCFARGSSESLLEPLLEYVSQLVVVRPEPDSIPVSAEPQAAAAPHAALAMRRHLEVLIKDWRIPLLEVEGTRLAAAGSWLSRTSVVKVMAAPELRFSLYGQARASPLLGECRPSRADAARWRHHELRHLPKFDCIVTAAAGDRAILQKQIPRACVRVVENGVDHDHFRNASSGAGDDQVLWIAEFEQCVNMHAFQMLTREIWPRVRKAFPRAALTVVAGADYRLHWRRRFHRGLPELPPEVTLLGHVGDLRPLYERSNVVIAPAPAGGAASPQVLEALAMSCAVVASSDACKGLGVAAGEHLLLAESPPQFADAVARLLADENLRRQLGRQGRLLVESGFNWGRSAAQQIEIYEELLREKGGVK
jgi:glycosyltransferase involved in cell wall biosynthesis